MTEDPSTYAQVTLGGQTGVTSLLLPLLLAWYRSAQFVNYSVHSESTWKFFRTTYECNLFEFRMIIKTQKGDRKSVV